jgi:UDP-glucose:(heptosyl)LPS alpha-1,3-glucosyltransferase
MTGVSRYVKEVASRLPGHGYDPVVLARRLPADGNALPPGLKVSRVPAVSLTSWTRAASFDLLARRGLRKRGAALVHGQGDLASQDVLSVHNCDAAAAVHVPDNRRPSPGTQYIRKRQFSPDGSRLIIVNSDMVLRDTVHFYNVPPEKIRRVYYGVDLERFHPRRRPAARAALLARSGWPQDVSVVLSVLSGDPAKRNVSLLPQAVELLDRKRPAALCVVGPVARLDQPAAARLAGKGRLLHVPATLDVESFFAAADAFALPAHYEEFGLTVLESLASGCPPVVSRRCGAAEVVTGGVDGEVFFDLKDPSELALGLEKVLNSPDRRPACRRTAEKFSWDNQVKEVVAVYRELQ